MRPALSRGARVALAVLLASLPAWPAGSTAQTQQAATDTWMAVADAQLATLRGGFVGAAGVVVSFGISRTVEVDGQQVAQLHVPRTDLRSLTPQQAQVLAAELAQARLVQSGPGNAAAATAGAGTAALIVQNTLNDRQIRSITQIDAASNGMGMLKQLNLGETLQRALAAGRGP